VLYISVFKPSFYNCLLTNNVLNTGLPPAVYNKANFALGRI